MTLMMRKDRQNGRRTLSVPVFEATCITVLMMSIIVSSTTAQKNRAQIVDEYLPVPVAAPTTPSADYLQTQNMELQEFDLLGCMSVSPQIVQCAANVYLTYLYPHVPLNIVSSCCVVIFKVGEKCLPKFTFPKIESRHFGFLNNLPNQLKQLCEVIQPHSSALSTSSTGGLAVSSKQNDQVVGECLFSKLRSVERCKKEVVTFFATLQVQIIGKSCCKAIIDITEGCWSSIFPFNPFFPSLLKNYCMPLLAFPPSP
ncbi:hypothetical protein C5167_002188 [Papaver somniferum]|uniref:Prolamin-like domain-containing protein n=1 Tax=Papaver somniferum TaxID=3469 RepID=A0A4Y7L1D5_PAPSO|nr:hypothetical protein C5167_002188 [Papaver somniferum]